MKYEKPAARGLDTLQPAAGECVSGSIPYEQCQYGWTNVGPCKTGNTAGQTCDTGSTPNAVTPCTAGNVVTHCVSGNVAGLE